MTIDGLRRTMVREVIDGITVVSYADRNVPAPCQNVQVIDGRIDDLRNMIIALEQFKHDRNVNSFTSDQWEVIVSDRRLHDAVISILDIIGA